MSILEVKTRILAGGRIEIPSTGLPEGREATVQIRVEDETPKRRISEILANYPAGQVPSNNEAQPTEASAGPEVTLDLLMEDEAPREKRSFLENLGGYKGGQLFRTAEEVDQYIKEERESWGD